VSFRGLAVVSTDDVWAVGGRAGMGTFAGRTLVEHWDGEQWQVVPSPSPGSGKSELIDVAAAGPNDVWAVGYAPDGALIEHWSGKAWELVSNPRRVEGLGSVSVLSKTDAWAVGTNDSDLRGFVEHWNGQRWSIVARLLLADGVEAISRHDVWATGKQIGHWNGRDWRVIRTRLPNVGRLQDVAAVSANDVWAGGVTRCCAVHPSSPGDKLLLVHWNGSRWTTARTPNIRGAFSEVNGIATVSRRNIWAVGDAQRDPGPGAFHALILHYACS
jgi:hypothetical protein